MQTGKKSWPWISDTKNTQVPVETPGSAAGTVEKPKLNYSYKAEEKIIVKKNELNLLSRNSIRKYDVIMN